MPASCPPPRKCIVAGSRLRQLWLNDVVDLEWFFLSACKCRYLLAIPLAWEFVELR